MSIVNAMSVDVEDYFQVSVFNGHVSRSRWDRLESRVCQNTERILAIFDEQGVRSTFFVLGWIAERFPDLVGRIVAGGHEVASHGYGHELVYEQSPEAFREDIRRSKEVLESVTGSAVSGYRAPSFSITKRSLWALDILIEEGFEYDASVFPIRHDRYGIPDAPRHACRFRRRGGEIMEVPGSTVQLPFANLPIAGGGYFRLLPYWWTHWGIARLNAREGKPALFYIHPWELDPDQPRLPTSWMGSVRHYRNLDKTEGRLRRLLGEFQFGTVSELLAVQPGREESAAAPLSSHV